MNKLRLLILDFGSQNEFKMTCISSAVMWKPKRQLHILLHGKYYAS